MTNDGAADCASWERLALPPSDIDRREDLAAVLASLRIPASVQHTRIAAEGTFAYIPVTADGAPLVVSPSYGPDVEWREIEIARLVAAIDAIAGRGATLAGVPIDPAHDERSADDPELPPRLDAIVWTTHEGDEFVAAVAYRFGMSFHVADAGVLGRLVAPEAEKDRAFFDGVWSMADGLAVWRSGAESGAAFVKGRISGTLVWRAPTVVVDPSLPDQKLDTGQTIASTLASLAPPENDTAPWVSRFGLDADHASRLRVLSRQDAGDGTLRSLTSILRIPRRLVDAVESPAGVRGLPDAEAIRPRGIRRQFLDAVAEGQRSVPWWRRSRTWLVVSTVAIVGLGVWSVLGIATGRVSTAFIPGLAAIAWAATLLIGRLASHREREYAPSLDADDRVHDETQRRP